MIKKATFSVDGVTKELDKTGEQIWSSVSQAPNEAGRYLVAVMVEDMVGHVTIVDQNDPRFNMLLNVEDENPYNINLIELLPEYLYDIREFKLIMEAESDRFNDFYFKLDKLVDFQFVNSMPVEILQRYETFLGIVGGGTVEQRRAYIKALYSKGYKLSETSIKAIVKSITGGKAVVKFFTGGEALNHNTGHGTLRVQVLSPDPTINYKFDDIIRAIAPYMPAHIKLELLRYFSTWEDIEEAHLDWSSIRQSQSWQTLYNYIPPQAGL